MLLTGIIGPYEHVGGARQVRSRGPSTVKRGIVLIREKTMSPTVRFGKNKVVQQS